ncbi:hypothetical protein [Dyella choica]|uniref:Uncharacterized protein n=1 Tax=Dyella choica TaxID=1927959 RepID=A0A3S0SAW0_9GAMM|nr:hypothetical protein [Dyella choica]RUL76856.1 hypothetical protein EKH80_09135 [Dyella choica]
MAPMLECFAARRYNLRDLARRAITPHACACAKQCSSKTTHVGIAATAEGSYAFERLDHQQDTNLDSTPSSRGAEFELLFPISVRGRGDAARSRGAMRAIEAEGIGRIVEVAGAVP